MAKGSGSESAWLASSEAKDAIAKLVTDIPRLQPLKHSWVWPNPALNVIDCVVSLKHNFERMVFPRVCAFKANHPEIASLPDLRDMIREKTPHGFGKSELNYNHAARMEILLAVTERLIKLVPDNDFAAWANSDRCGDETCFGVKGFGPAGFQYLRILFGAQTFKPDVHILAHVKEVTGLTVAPNRAVKLLSMAATQAGVAARDLDHTIWRERSGATFDLAC